VIDRRTLIRSIVLPVASLGVARLSELEVAGAQPIGRRANLREQVRFQPAQDVGRVLGDPSVHLLVVPLSGDALEAIGDPSFSFAFRGFACRTRVYAIREQRTSFVTTLACDCQRHIFGDAEGQELPFAGEAIREARPPATRRRDLQVQPAGVIKTLGCLAGFRVADRSRSQGH